MLYRFDVQVLLQSPSALVNETQLPIQCNDVLRFLAGSARAKESERITATDAPLAAKQTHQGFNIVHLS